MQWDSEEKEIFNSRMRGQEAGMPGLEPNHKRSAILGITLASVSLLMLLMVLLVPWLVVEEYVDFETEETEFEAMDFWGNGYLGKDSDDDVIIDDEGWNTLDELDNGRWFSLWGAIIGLIVSIGLIPLGFIKTRSDEVSKILSVCRAFLGIVLIIPGTFLMLGGARFVGLCISLSTSGKDPLKFIPIQPIFNMLGGAFILIMAMIIIGHEKGIISFRNKKARKSLPWEMQESSDSMIKYSRLMVIVIIVILVSMPILPLITATTSYEGDTDREDSTSFISQSMFSAYDYDDGDSKVSKAVKNFGVFNSMMWVCFYIALVALMMGILYYANWSPMTFNIIGLITTLICIPLVIGTIFKIIAIVQSFDSESEELFDSTYKSSSFYAYNYIPLLALIGLFAAVVLFTIVTIKAMVKFFKEYGADEANAGPILANDMYHKNIKRGENVAAEDPFGRRDEYHDPFNPVKPSPGVESGGVRIIEDEAATPEDDDDFWNS